MITASFYRVPIRLTGPPRPKPGLEAGRVHWSIPLPSNEEQYALLESRHPPRRDRPPA